MTRSDLRHKLLFGAKHCWTILVLIALAYYLWGNGHRVIDSVRSVPVFNVIVALICIVIGKFAAVYVMRASLKLQASRLQSWEESVWVYASADVAKYMPGGVWAIVGRVVQYRNYGMSAEAMSKALFFENMAFGVSALPLVLPIGALLFVHKGWLTPVSAGIAIALVAVGVLALVRLARRLSLLGTCTKGARITVSTLVVMFLGWIFMGTSWFVLLPTSESVLHWVLAIGSYATAFIAGMVAVFAPAGVGVREGVLVIIGQFSSTPSTVMLDAAILNRAIWVIADTCVFAFALFARLPGK